jgi:hypothetical protein
LALAPHGCASVRVLFGPNKDPRAILPREFPSELVAAVVIGNPTFEIIGMSGVEMAR